jgi:hypothetical protein
MRMNFDGLLELTALPHDVMTGPVTLEFLRLSFSLLSYGLSYRFTYSDISMPFAVRWHLSFFLCFCLISLAVSNSSDAPCRAWQ